MSARGWNAELLKIVTGTSRWAVIALALAVPLLVSVRTIDIETVVVGGAGATSAELLQPCAWVFVAALFLGSFSVTREYYYSTMGRTLTQMRRERVLAAKSGATAVVSAVIALGVGLVGWGVWTILGPLSAIVRQYDAVLFNLAGTMLASSLAAVMGVSVGWLVRNYYLAAALVLVVPLVVEFPLVSSDVTAAAYLPSGALLRVALPADLGVELWGSGVGVALLWTAILYAMSSLAIKLGR